MQHSQLWNFNTIFLHKATLAVYLATFAEFLPAIFWDISSNVLWPNQFCCRDSSFVKPGAWNHLLWIGALLYIHVKGPSISPGSIFKAAA